MMTVVAISMIFTTIVNANVFIFNNISALTKQPGPPGECRSRQALVQRLWSDSLGT